MDRGDHRRDGVVIGLVEALDAALPLVGSHRVVGRDHRAVIELADEGRIVLAAVRVDQQAREIGEDRRRAGHRGELRRHGLDADIVGDVTPELVFRQTEIAILVRQRVAGMVGDQDETLRAVALDDRERREDRGAGHDGEVRE